MKCKKCNRKGCLNYGKYQSNRYSCPQRPRWMPRWLSKLLGPKFKVCSTVWLCNEHYLEENLGLYTFKCTQCKKEFYITIKDFYEGDDEYLYCSHCGTQWYEKWEEELDGQNNNVARNPQTES